jgi:uncharacterized protein YjdB
MNKKGLSILIALFVTVSAIAPVSVFAAKPADTTTVGVTYSAYAQNLAWITPASTDGTPAGTEGQSLRLEDFNASLTGAPAGASLTYQAYVQNKAWLPAVSDGANAGTEHQSLRIEEVRLTLSGLPGYEVQYEVHGQNYGWSEGWKTAENGTAIADAPLAGTEHQSLRIEAIAIRVVPIQGYVAPVTTTATAITATKATIAIGDSTGFSFADSTGAAVTPTGATYAVVGSNAANGIVSASGIFTATVAGKYTVQATIGTTVLSTTVNVLGAASSVTLQAANASVVDIFTPKADSVTATVIDSNNNLLPNYSGPVEAYVDSTSIVGVNAAGSVSGSGYLVSPYVFTAKNGVATFSVDAGGVKGTGVIYVGVPDASGNVSTWKTISISAVDPVATAIKAVSGTPANITSALAFSGETVTFNIVDQGGNLVSSANYNGSVTISGPAEFSNGSQTYALSFEGGSATTQIFRSTSASTTGTITVTPSVSGLTETPASINVYSVAQKATQLTIPTLPTTTSFTSDTAATTADFIEYDAQAVDASGFAATSSPSSVNVTVLGPSGTPSTAIGVLSGGSYVLSTATTPVNIAVAAGNTYTVELGLHAGVTAVPTGTYTVKIADATAGTTLATLNETFTITTGKVYAIAVTPTASPYDLAVSSPSTTVSAQLTDKWGNKVAQGGVIVDFTGGATGFATNVPQVQTNASGIATVTASDKAATPASGDNGVVTANIDSTWVAAHNPEYTLTAGVSTGTLLVTGNQVTSIILNLSATSIAANAAAPTVTTQTINGVGAYVTGDTLGWTLTSTNSLFTTVTGTAAVGSTITGWPTNLPKAGTYTLTITDTSLASVPAVSKTFTVNAGAIASTTVGSATSDKANTPVALTVATVDAYGNPVAVSSNDTIALSDGGLNGVFALTAGGSPITSVTLAAGQSSVQVFYVNSSDESPITFTGISSFGTAARTLSGAAISITVPSSLVLTYSGALSTANTPAVTDYKVTVDGLNDAVTAVTISGSTVTLTLAGGVTSASHTVAVSYTAGSSPLLDSNANAVSSFSGQFVTLNNPA